MFPLLCHFRWKLSALRKPLVVLSTFFSCTSTKTFLDSIFLSLSPRPTLFASFKYVGNSFDADMTRMAANPKVQEWWKFTDGMQESPVEGAVESASGPGWWGQTEEVFYVE